MSAENKSAATNPSPSAPQSSGSHGVTPDQRDTSRLGLKHSELAQSAQPSGIDRFLEQPPATMKGVYYDQYGDVNVLKFGNLPTPEPRINQILIRVMATSVNPIDWRLRKGGMKQLLRGHFPRIPGYDVAGYVIEAGGDITLNRGDRVMAFLDSMYGGAYAQYAVCGMNAATLLPDDLSFEEAAAMPLAGSTALQSLRNHGHIHSGSRVLIIGASGGVGGFAVQIAKHDGAHVTAVSSGINKPYVKALGADEFIDYHQQDFSSSNQQWDLIFDAAGKSNFSNARRVLTQKGRYVSTEPSLKGALVSAATLLSSQRCRVMLAKPKREDLSELVRLYTTGAMKSMVDDVMPITDASEAHRLSEHGKLRGKLVMRLVG